MTPAYNGPERRESPVSWAEIEVGLRKIVAEELGKLEIRIYERSFDPLKAEVEAQKSYCDQHSQRLTAAETVLGEIAEAKLIRRVEVAESRLSLIGKSTVMIGGGVIACVTGLIVAVLSNHLRF